MSLQNFIPTIWSNEILKTFETSHIMANLCNRNYEGDISQMGDSIKIGSIGDITVSSYTKNSTSLTVQELQVAQTVLLIDQAKYFAFQVDDVDKAQANVNVMQEAMRKAAYKLSETVDLAIARLYGSAANTITDASFDAALAFDTIALANQYLSEAGVPRNGRWLVLPPWAITKLILAKVLNTEGSVDANGELNNGFVGRVMGFNVYESNNLYQTGTAPAYTTIALAGVNEAISYAEQVVSVEAYRHPDYFQDNIKGLHVYGYKVVQPKGLVALSLAYAAETT